MINYNIPDDTDCWQDDDRQRQRKWSRDYEPEDDYDDDDKHEPDDISDGPYNYYPNYLTPKL